MPKRAPQPKPKRAPDWEKPPKPVAGGTEVLGRCRSRTGILILVSDVISPLERQEAVLTGVNPPCRHCGRPYESLRRRPRRQS